MEVIKYSIALVFIILATISDYKSFKIKNKLVLTFLVIGFAFNGITAGTTGVLDSLYGALFPLVLFPLFAVRMLGAGDVKAFCAIGSILGLTQSIHVVIFSFIGGGVIAIFFMIFRQNALSRFKSFCTYIKMCFYSKKLLSYDQFTNSKGKFRFAYGILAGYLIMLTNNHLMLI